MRLFLDRRVSVKHASNAAFGWEADVGWTFFDLCALQDEFKDAPGSVIEVDL